MVTLEAAYCRFNNARSLRAEDGALEAKSFGGVQALRDTTRAGDGYYNRAVGLGPEDVDQVDAIVEWFRSPGLTPRFDLTPDRETPAVRHALRRHGLQVDGNECYFHATPVPQTGRPAGGIELELVTPARVDRVLDFLSIDSGNPALAPSVREKGRVWYSKPEFRNYLAHLDGNLAGMATLYLAAGAAYFANALTLERYRGRGCQSALLTRRINDAVEAGCDLAVSDAVFGDGQPPESRESRLSDGVHDVALDGACRLSRETSRCESNSRRTRLRLPSASPAGRASDASGRERRERNATQIEATVRAKGEWKAVRRRWPARRPWIWACRKWLSVSRSSRSTQAVWQAAEPVG
jgi:hypothetical protein